MAGTLSTAGDQDKSFGGFESLDANFIYCPNQFLDLCLKHCTRSEVRAIAHVIVETLQWRDKNGQPIRQDIEVPYTSFSREANVSERSVKAALFGAVSKGFLVCKQEPKPKQKGKPAQTGIYALNWDYSEEYVSSLAGFDGFFGGEGRRTPLPVEFFRQVIPNATLSAIRVTGTVLRHTLGYQTQCGRRDQAPLSYDALQSHSGIKDRKDVARGIEESIEANYIQRVVKGAFDQDADKRTPSIYGPKWLVEASNNENDAINPLADSGKNPTRTSTQNTHQQGGKKPTENEATNPPGNSSKNPTSRKKVTKTLRKQTNKQQGAAVSLLIAEGFQEREAIKISAGKSLEEIQQQIAWLPFREPNGNPLGYLRRAIECNYGEPSSHSKQAGEQATINRVHENSAVATQEASSDLQRLKEESKYKQALHRERMRIWKEASTHEMKKQWYKAALETAQTDAAREKIHNADPDNPPAVLLKQIPLPDSISLPSSTCQS